MALKLWFSPLYAKFPGFSTKFQTSRPGKKTRTNSLLFPGFSIPWEPCNVSSWSQMTFTSCSVLHIEDASWTASARRLPLQNGPLFIHLNDVECRRTGCCWENKSSNYISGRYIKRFSTTKIILVSSKIICRLKELPFLWIDLSFTSWHEAITQKNYF